MKTGYNKSKKAFNNEIDAKEKEDIKDTIARLKNKTTS